MDSIELSPNSLSDVHASTLQRELVLSLDELTKATDDFNTMSQLEVIFDGKQETGVDPIASEIARISVEAILARFGVVGAQPVLAMEHFDSPHTKVRATKISLENFRDFLRKIFIAIRDAVVKFGDGVRWTLDTMFSTQRKARDEAMVRDYKKMFGEYKDGLPGKKSAKTEMAKETTDPVFLHAFATFTSVSSVENAVKIYQNNLDAIEIYQNYTGPLNKVLNAVEGCVEHYKKTLAADEVQLDVLDNEVRIIYRQVEDNLSTYFEKVLKPRKTAQYRHVNVPSFVTDVLVTPKLTRGFYQAAYVTEHDPDRIYDFAESFEASMPVAASMNLPNLQQLEELITLCDKNSKAIHSTLMKSSQEYFRALDNLKKQLNELVKIIDQQSWESDADEVLVRASLSTMRVAVDVVKRHAMGFYVKGVLEVNKTHSVCMALIKATLDYDKSAPQP